jgi:hypothetical protein
MHRRGCTYYNAGATTNKQGNNTTMQKGGHNNSSANNQTVMCKPMNEVGLLYSYQHLNVADISGLAISW